MKRKSDDAYAAIERRMAKLDFTNTPLDKCWKRLDRFQGPIWKAAKKCMTDQELRAFLYLPGNIEQQTRDGERYVEAVGVIVEEFLKWKIGGRRRGKATKKK